MTALLASPLAAATEPKDGLEGLVLCGYQGWFRCKGDGAENGWHHLAVNGKFEPGHSHIEMWPDVSELGPKEKFPTPFHHADGRVAEVFSSVNGPTVRRHFKWMREYGIDGVFLQRFATTARDEKARAAMDQVLDHCHESAEAEGRKWAVMYDLSGLKPNEFSTVPEDWKRLQQEGHAIGGGDCYLRVRQKPLIALWGLGFSDRPAGLTEWESLIGFFHSKGCSVMVGVPYYWRSLQRDAVADQKVHELIAMAEVVSPWSVGRIRTPEDAAAGVNFLKEDLAWCREKRLIYLPVAFPGFSWHNLQKSRGQDGPFNDIPRLGGKFLWERAKAVRKAGAEALYVAMFDEMDEGTAIFKTSQDPPVGESPFLCEPGLKPDHYLWLTGEIGSLMRGERPEDFPLRK